MEIIQYEGVIDHHVCLYVQLQGSEVQICLEGVSKIMMSFHTVKLVHNPNPNFPLFAGWNTGLISTMNMLADGTKDKLNVVICFDCLVWNVMIVWSEIVAPNDITSAGMQCW